MDKAIKGISGDFALHLNLAIFMLDEGVNPATYPFIGIQTKDLRTNLCLN